MVKVQVNLLDLSNKEDFLDSADLFDNKYKHLGFAELMNGINLADNTNLSALHLQSVIIVNHWQQLCQIQYRVLTNSIQNVLSITKVINKKSFIIERQKPLTFKFVDNVASVLQNNFGQMNIICNNCKAYYWTIKQTTLYFNIKPNQYIFYSCCKKKILY